MDKRKENILNIIIKEYIKDAKPIGSKKISSILKCSSATIRNEMVKLEELGYLKKTHSSSGRIPSDKGYRYYVDHLIEPKKMTGEDMLKLQTIFQNQQLQVNDVIRKSLEIISDITNYTGIVLGSKAKDNKLKKVEIVPLKAGQVLTIVITDLGHVEHKTINIEDVSISEVRKIVELINKLIVGTSIDRISEKLEFEIKPIISKYVKQYETLYNAFYNVFSEFSTENIPIQILGKNNILNQPEFDNVQKIKNILKKFEDIDLIQDIKEDDKDISIYIGEESLIDEDITVIKTKYQVGDVEKSIAVIGPKRMEYNRIISMINYIKENLERI